MPGGNVKNLLDLLSDLDRPIAAAAEPARQFIGKALPPLSPVPPGTADVFGGSAAQDLFELARPGPEDVLGPLGKAASFLPIWKVFGEAPVGRRLSSSSRGRAPLRASPLTFRETVFGIDRAGDISGTAKRIMRDADAELDALRLDVQDGLVPELTAKRLEKRLKAARDKDIENLRQWLDRDRATKGFTLDEAGNLKGHPVEATETPVGRFMASQPEDRVELFDDYLRATTPVEPDELSLPLKRRDRIGFLRSSVRQPTTQTRDLRLDNLFDSTLEVESGKVNDWLADQMAQKYEKNILSNEIWPKD